MSILLEGPFEPVVAAWTWEHAEEGSAIELPDRVAAMAWLRRLVARAGAMTQLRRLIAEQRVFAVHRLEDAEVLDWLADRIAAGSLRLVARPVVAHGILAAHGEDEEAFEPPPSSTRSAAQELTWITIELVGEDDRPIPGERYRIELTDGAVREGRLDGEGLARVRGIDPGECTVTFPDLDQEAWTSIGTTGVP